MRIAAQEGVWELSLGDQPIAIIELVVRAKRGELALDEIRALSGLIEDVSKLDQATQKLFEGAHARK
jgi:hypothetical protein